MPMTPAQAATVGGIALLGLGLGFGGASLAGSNEGPAAPSTAAAASLPPVAAQPSARIAVLGDAAALPAPKSAPRRRAKSKSTPRQPASNPGPSATTAPTAQPRAVPTLAPAKPQPPKPARTPDQGVIGGG